MAELNVNGKKYKVDVDPDTPLLWVIREQVGLTGTKYGCGVGVCGACTVLFEGENKEGYIYGFTENYVKVKYPYDPQLVNTFQEIILTEVDRDGIMKCELLSTK